MGSLTLGLQGPAPESQLLGSSWVWGSLWVWHLGPHMPEEAAACVTPFHTGPQDRHGHSEALILFCSMHGPGPTNISLCPSPLPPVFPCLSRHTQILLQAPHQSWEGSGGHMPITALLEKDQVPTQGPIPLGHPCSPSGKDSYLASFVSSQRGSRNSGRGVRVSRICWGIWSQ